MNSQGDGQVLLDTNSQPEKPEDDGESNVQTNDAGEHVDQLMGSNYYNTLHILKAKYLSCFTDRQQG